MAGSMRRIQRFMFIRPARGRLGLS